ncbi:MAG: SDR family NAD(P)-dependent oxidoreductase [Terriglobia bacterium]
MGKLNGKVAMVTGGGGLGIGHGISIELAREGAHVVIAEIDAGAAESVSHKIRSEGGEASAVECDVSQATRVKDVIDHVVRDHLRLDVLVNNAGVGLIRPPAEASEEEFDHLMSIDLRGVWLCSKYAIPHMQRQKGGSIINIASVHSRATLPRFGLYAAMKAGVCGLTRGMAVEYGPDGIRANTVCPGLVDSPQNHEILAKIAPDAAEWMRNFVHRDQALPWMIQPEDIGRVVAFLACDDSRAITGAEIPVDAGTWAQLTSRG